MRAIESLRPMVVGRDAEALFADMGAFARALANNSHLPVGTITRRT